MKIKILLVLPLLLISNKINGQFSITNPKIIKEINESSINDRTQILVEEDNSESKIIAATLEIYYFEFLHSVKNLMKAVNLKEKLMFTQKEINATATKNDNYLYQLVYHEAYNDKTSYDSLWQEMINTHKTFKEKTMDKELNIRDDFNFYFSDSPEEHRKKMIENSNKIMNNLLNKKNQKQNKKNAEAGILYFQSLQ
ncbi:hypothetical protein NAT47_08115 [Flavobacterium sp. HXWNR69]|uniref:DUF4142 domain-containing protein n=1 Tax=Flavobacterium fragile TaxID=2949085 RepID=A0ABT0THC9_9FLAO|nr:hypothetical protein [Flavobacterium sp. HXWNR69]MCL9770381.1 hypothetical protein [Flavobacterium sp. HXWNR69]